MKMRKISLLLRLIVLCLVVYGTFTLVNMGREIAEKEEQIALTAAQITQTELETQKLQENFDAYARGEGTETIARDELGLVSPGEIIFKESGK